MTLQQYLNLPKSSQTEEAYNLLSVEDSNLLHDAYEVQQNGGTIGGIVGGIVGGIIGALPLIPPPAVRKVNPPPVYPIDPP